MDRFRRRTPEEILQSISRLQRGTFIVYIGPVSGSGKTYHMLREGHSLQQQGMDVVICAVTTLQRPETVEQVGDLERVPSIHWFQDGVEQKDLNLEALLARRPEVVLVDGLAHRNRPGARFATRLEDIRWLLAQRISVITTVNVYELEGYTEIARRMTGIEAIHTVPAGTLELADEVRLIDVTPETLLTRLAEGHLKGNQAVSVFESGHLGVLRELALRLVAEDVNAALEEHRDELGLTGPSGVAERILVSAQYHWNGAVYVRRGHQIAKRLNGELLVATFRSGGKSLSREESVFRRSMLKLVEKARGRFEELPYPGRRRVAKALVRYAACHKATRIVLGHSKQTRWQELWQGSIVNRLLKLTRCMDVFLVADRSSYEGGRAHYQPEGRDAVPAQQRIREQLPVERRGSRTGRGKLKVYIGAAPGVGKTYAMLREGNDLLKKGMDVRIGLLETHGRVDTKAQIGSLPIIPRRELMYQQARLEEMDTDAIVQLSPEVVLIDELAHTNVPGSRYAKRFEDVLEVLNAGISVITTVNVQHLESLNDAVEQMTGIRVRETVPDSLLRMADEVQLIDVSPEALQERLRAGKVYARTKVEQALGHFFQTGNLIALRELALREIADDVDERLESQERKSSLRGPWRRREVIFVCVGASPQAERLIRRGFRTAYRLKAAWYVGFALVEGQPMTAELALRLEVLEKLTSRLGGKFMVHPCPSVKRMPWVLAARAKELEATQLIVGRSRPSFGWRRLWSSSLINPLIRLTRQMDVLIAADYERSSEI